MFFKGYVDDMRIKLIKGRPKLDKVKTEMMEERLRQALAFAYPIIIKANMADKFHVLDYLPIFEPSDLDEPFDVRGYEEGPKICTRGLCQVINNIITCIHHMSKYAFIIRCSRCRIQQEPNPTFALRKLTI